jgi:hypothetical protein
MRHKSNSTSISTTQAATETHLRRLQAIALAFYEAELLKLQQEAVAESGQPTSRLAGAFDASVPSGVSGTSELL